MRKKTEFAPKLPENAIFLPHNDEKDDRAGENVRPTNQERESIALLLFTLPCAAHGNVGAQALHLEMRL